MMNSSTCTGQMYNASASVTSHHKPHLNSAVHLNMQMAEAQVGLDGMVYVEQLCLHFLSSWPYPGGEP